MKETFCEEHSGIKSLLKTLLALVGTAVVLLLFQVGLTLNMGSNLRAEMASNFIEMRRDVSGLRERVAALEQRNGIFQNGH